MSYVKFLLWLLVPALTAALKGPDFLLWTTYPSQNDVHTHGIDTHMGTPTLCGATGSECSVERLIIVISRDERVDWAYSSDWSVKTQQPVPSLTPLIIDAHFIYISHPLVLMCMPTDGTCDAV